MHSNTTGTTIARIEAIKGFYQPGMTARDMASLLSRMERCEVTRMAVIGIYNRNRDALANYPLPPKQEPKEGSRRKAKAFRPRQRKPAIVPPRPVQSNVVPFAIPESAFTYVATHPTKKLYQLEANECRWPMNGKGADMQFCSQHAEGSYCEHHRLMSIGQGSRGEQEALKTLRKMA